MDDDVRQRLRDAALKQQEDGSAAGVTNPRIDQVERLKREVRETVTQNRANFQDAQMPFSLVSSGLAEKFSPYPEQVCVYFDNGAILSLDVSAYCNTYLFSNDFMVLDFRAYYLTLRGYHLNHLIPFVTPFFQVATLREIQQKYWQDLYRNEDYWKGKAFFYRIELAATDDATIRGLIEGFNNFTKEPVFSPSG